LEGENDLETKFTFKRYDCDGVEIWLQAVDADTGDTLFHSIVRSGNIKALGACELHPAWCGNDPVRYQGEREKYMLLTHRNNDGNNGLHVAAQMGQLPLVRAILRLFDRRDMDAGEAIPGEYDERRQTQDDHISSNDARRILFIEARNGSGRTTVEEAQDHGHTHIADFLEYVLEQSYPLGCSDREAARAKAMEVVNLGFNFRTP
jgi:hypothetical protein